MDRYDDDSFLEAVILVGIVVMVIWVLYGLFK